MKFKESFSAFFLCSLSFSLFSMNADLQKEEEGTISIAMLPVNVLQEIASFCHDYTALMMRATSKAMRRSFSFPIDDKPLLLTRTSKHIHPRAAKRQALVSLIMSFPLYQCFALRSDPLYYKIQRIVLDYKKLPKGIKNRIVALDLSSMSLTTVPLSLSCFCIVHLSLANNKISKLSLNCFRRFKKLRYLSLVGNPLESNDVQILNNALPGVTINFSITEGSLRKSS